MTDRMYDVMKWIAMVVLPALGTLYFALAGIWGFPYGEEVVGTITAIDAFLGALLDNHRNLAERVTIHGRSIDELEKTVAGNSQKIKYIEKEIGK